MITLHYNYVILLIVVLPFLLGTSMLIVFPCFLITERQQILTHLPQLQILNQFYEFQVLYIPVLKVVQRITWTQMERLLFSLVTKALLNQHRGRKVQCKNIYLVNYPLVVSAAFFKQFSMVCYLLISFQTVVVSLNP